MTTETWSGALCGSTPESSRRRGEAANTERALEGIGLRIAALRMADDQPCRAGGEKEADQPLHRRSRAKARRAPRELERDDRGEPAAEGAGEDVERPVHADHRARKRRHGRDRKRRGGPRARAEAERQQAADREDGGGVA